MQSGLAYIEGMTRTQNILAGIEIKNRINGGETLECKTHCTECGNKLADDEGTQINPLEILCENCWEAMTGA